MILTATKSRSTNGWIRKGSAIFVLLIVAFTGQAQYYFQQQVDHEIHVSLDDQNHMIRGFEKVRYQNNSPDTLKEIWFHLWPNAYSGRKTGLCRQMLEDGDDFLYYADSKNRGWIDSLEFRSGGQKLHFSIDSDNPDISLVRLGEPLLPGKAVDLHIPFRVIIPSGSISRLGHIGESYQISQWFPKPAVYDKNGWHPMPYLGQGEFFSEFGTYDVHITLPTNYVVGATGILQNQKELKWLSQKDSLTRAISSFSDDLSFPLSDSTKKTLHYHAENVHDFAWFADKRYHVLKGEIEFPSSGRTVTTWAMFTNNEADLWKAADGYLRDATFYYSHWLGEYPYDQVTAVDGTISEGGGMEYPMITVIGESGSDVLLDQVITHEVGHNWFYGILASNERDHAWMDEGMNSFIEMKYMKEKYPDLMLIDLVSPFPKSLGRYLNIGHFPGCRMNQLAASLIERSGTSQAIDLHSDAMTSTNYGAMVYARTAMVFEHLNGYLGEEKMKELLRSYYQKWKFKHPSPADLKAHAEQSTGEKLDWLFDGLIASSDKLNFRLSKVKLKDESVDVTVKNTSKINAPVSLGVFKGDSLLETVWTKPLAGKTTVSIPCDFCDRVVIDPDYQIPEISRKDNESKVSGIFKKWRPWQFRVFGAFERDDKVLINFSPTIGWNNNDGFMLGGAFYNNLLPNNKFDYFIMPMYAFGAKTLVGQYKMGYTFGRGLNSIKVRIGVRGGRYYLNHSSSVDFTQAGPIPYSYGTGFTARPNISVLFADTDIRRPKNHQLTYTHHVVAVKGIPSASGLLVIEQTPELMYKAGSAGLPMSFAIEATAQLVQLERPKLGITLQSSYQLHRVGTKVKFRTFLGLTTNSATNAGRLRMASWNPTQDYLAEQYWMNRGTTNSDVFSKQTVQNEGGFRTGTFLGSSSSYLWTAHINFRGHRKVPLEWFAGIAVYPSVPAIHGSDVGVSFETGLSIILWRDIIEIHIPVAWDKVLGDLVRRDQPRFYDRIRFNLNIERIKPRKYLHQLLN